MPKDTLKPGFDPYWQSDFLDFKAKELSKTAFILRQMYRVFRDPATNICNLSDLKIREITGWDRLAIKNARESLVTLKEITPLGYHTFQIASFRKKQSCGETPQPTETPVAGKPRNQLHENPSTSCGETTHQLRGNPATYPISEQRYRNTETGKSDFQSVEKPVDKVCGDCLHLVLDHPHIERNNPALKNTTKAYCPKLFCHIPPSLDASSCEFYQPTKGEKTDGSNSQ